MGRAARLIRGALSGLILAAAVATPATLHAETSNLESTFARGTRFIDLLKQNPTVSALPTQGDLNLRFGNGTVAYGAQDVREIKDRSLAGHIGRINRIMDSLLAAYHQGPKPSHIPFVIVSTNDVNCAITPIAPEQYRTHFTQLGTLAADARPVDLSARPQAPYDPTATAPVSMEMRCSRLFLDQVTSDDEMAFVIAHELSHVLLGHWRAGDSDIRQQARTQHSLDAGLGLISAMQNIQGTSGGLLQATGSQYYGETAHRLTAANYMLSEYNIVIHGPAWQREQERDADILALDLLYQAGFSRAGSWQILTKAADAQKALDAKSTYVDNLVKSASSQMILSVSPDQFSMLSAARNTAVSVGASVYGHFRDSQIQKVHDNADVRTKAVIKYESEHPTAEKASAAEADFFGGNSFARASAPIGRASDFVAAIQSGSCDNLTSEQNAQLNSMLRAKSRSQSESEALYVYYQCTGNDARALTYAGEAAAGPSTSSGYYTDYILALIKAGQYAKADGVISRAARQAPPYDQYVFLDIEVKMALGQTERGVKIAEACYVALRQSNPNGAHHCLDLASIDNHGRHVDPGPPPPTIETRKGVVAGAESVGKYTVYGMKKRAGSLISGTKDFLGIDKPKDDATAPTAEQSSQPVAYTSLHKTAVKKKRRHR